VRTASEAPSLVTTSDSAVQTACKHVVTLPHREVSGMKHLRELTTLSGTTCIAPLAWRWTRIQATRRVSRDQTACSYAIPSLRCHDTPASG
jgi:hypothetical protein